MGLRFVGWVSRPVRARNIPRETDSIPRSFAQRTSCLLFYVRNSKRVARYAKLATAKAW